MINILKDWSNYEFLDITEEKIQERIIISDKHVALDAKRSGAIAQLIGYTYRKAEPSTTEQDVSGIDSIRKETNGIAKLFQTKGYINVPCNIYMGHCAKDQRYREIFENAKNMIIAYTETKIEMLFKDNIFKNDFFDIVSPLIVYDIIDHFAIKEDETLFKLLLTMTREQVVENLDLCRIKSAVTVDDFIFDLIEIKKRIGEKNGYNN